MANNNANPKKNWIFWASRIIAIIFIGFLSLFSLDVFSMNGYEFWETILAFLIHNIPVFILIVALCISWNKNEWVAGTTFIAAGIFYIVFLGLTTSISPWIISNIALIACPAILVGILFFINWYKKREAPNKDV